MKKVKKKSVKKRSLEKSSRKRFSKKKIIPTKKSFWRDTKYVLPVTITLIIIVALVVGLYYLISANVVAEGKTIGVNYVLTVDGEVFDTNEGMDPFVFTVGAGQVIPGFDENVKGMAVGDVKIFVLSPEEGYGASNPEMIFELPLLQELSKYDYMELEQYFSLFNETPMEGEVVESELWPWKFGVVGVNETSVKVENLLEVGEVIELDTLGWVTEVVEVNEDMIILLQKPSLGDDFVLPFGVDVMQGKVVEIEDVNFTVDFNSPLVGKELSFEVTLLEILEEQSL